MKLRDVIINYVLDTYALTKNAEVIGRHVDVWMEEQQVKNCLIGDVVKPLTAGRHRWKYHGRNRKKCVKCGCLKDITASQSFHTYLQKGGEWSFSRPVCDG